MKFMSEPDMISHQSDGENPLIPTDPALIGQALIRYEYSLAPDSPGVYRMIANNGDVLYVGKAKSLKRRISQYAGGRGHTNRILRMIALTHSMILVRTATEGEALLLEARLIKALKPRYNVLLRDDKSFAEIALRLGHEAPQITKHRGAHQEKTHYFGPFASTLAVNRTLDTLQRAFLLRTCTDSVYAGRNRPCMLYQIKRCSGPCTREISLEAYGELVEQAERFLRGKSRDIIDQLSSQMMEASDSLEFERAAKLRDRVKALSHVSMSSSIGLGEEEADVFGLYRTGGHACVFAVFYRAGQNWGDRAYFPRIDAEATDHEIIDALLGQFYQSKPVPRLILVSILPSEPALMEEALMIKSGRKVEIRRPQRGEKREVLDRAQKNAEAALGRKLSESSAQKALLEALAETFKLEGSPERIEIYDNSHLSGTHAVGGMVVAGPEGFVRGQYRRFTIKDAEILNGDDFAMMKQVFLRRFTRLIKGREDPEVLKGFGQPDLVFVDGGLGQLNAALSVLEELGLNHIKVIGVAKGPDRDAGLERFFVPGLDPFMLDKKSPVLYYIQRLRDEAHRYAIGANRQMRQSSLKQNPLDDISGIGGRRKRALLQAFGSARSVSEASIEDLMKVEGISRAMAEKIHDHFH
jgi:excinuclease ABC subunit C